jgi:orotate phosphoribosyltransferase
MLREYQQSFIHFLVQARALRFGSFTLKSGRQAPYFINTGLFNNGPLVSTLGRYYGRHIKEQYQPLPDVVFGPAYKGIPLAVSTAIALAEEWDANVGYCFDRKEAKQHGDGGMLVGTPLSAGQRVLLVEDVITAGTTLQKIVPAIRSIAAVDIVGVVVAVDRCERGTGSTTAVRQVSEELGISVSPIVTIHDILAELSEPNASGLVLTAADQEAIRSYLAEYGGAS